VEKYTIASLPIAQWLGATNSSINPLLYAIFNQKFREGYKALLSGKICQAFDYSNSMKYFSSRAGTALKRKKNRKKPEMRKTIGAIYVHMDKKQFGGRITATMAEISDVEQMKASINPRSLSVKEVHRNEEFSDSMVQFCSKKYANSFV